MKRTKKRPITWRIALHEAGHAVVGDALGLEVRCIERTSDGARTGLLVHAADSPAQHFALAAMSMAGGAAEMRSGERPGEGCEEDLGYAIEHAAEYVKGTKGAEVLRRATWLACSIVNDRWATVRAIAAALRERGRLGVRPLARLLAPYRSEYVARVRGHVRPEAGVRVKEGGGS